MVPTLAPPLNIQEAEQVGVTYFLGKKRFEAKEGSNIFHRFLAGAFKILVMFSRAGHAQLKVPDEQSIEVGLKVRL